MKRPTLKSVPSETPDPPYPATTKGNGYRPEVDWQRIKSSKTWRLCPDEQKNNLLRVWLESWNEVPVGSWEEDDEMIATAVNIPVRIFLAHRDQLMRGWYRCTDDRLYHPVITEMVEAMIGKRKGVADRVKKHREKHDVTRYQHVSNAQEQEQVQEQEQETYTPYSSSSSSSVGDREKEKDVCCFSLSGMPDDWKKFAEEARPDLNAEIVFREFADHWTVGEGSGQKRAHWDAVWRKWVGREKGTKINSSNGDGNGKSVKHHRQESAADRYNRLIAEREAARAAARAATNGYEVDGRDDGGIRGNVSFKDPECASNGRMGIIMDGDFRREKS